MPKEQELREALRKILKLAQKPDASCGNIPFEDFWTDEFFNELKAHGCVMLDEDQTKPQEDSKWTAKYALRK